MSGPSVGRRKVFYLPGYDPFPPRRYRELYRTEAAQQAELSGHEIRLIRRTGEGGYGWQVAAEVEGAAVFADVEVLVWSDIVQASMGQGIGSTYRQLIRTAWAYIGSGALMRLMRLRRGPMIAALYPIVVLVLELLLAVMLGGLCARYLALPGQGGLVIRAALFAAIVWAALWLFRRSDGRIYAWYLMHDYAFTAAEGGAYPAALELRLLQFRDRIVAAADEDWDEVLVVGHSSGAHLGISVLADVMRGGGWPADGPVLSLLTLGQVVPMVSFLPRAGRLRGDLRLLSTAGELTWVDVTAPGDGCAFALCDPVAVSGMATAARRWPLVLSAAFSRTLSPARWQALRRRYFRLHFQYLCAFDNLPGQADDYDYFAITAGPLTLGARLGQRPPSKSRIETALNRYGAAK